MLQLCLPHKLQSSLLYLDQDSRPQKEEAVELHHHLHSHLLLQVAPRSSLGSGQLLQLAQFVAQCDARCDAVQFADVPIAIPNAIVDATADETLESLLRVARSTDELEELLASLFESYRTFLWTLSEASCMLLFVAFESSTLETLVGFLSRSAYAEADLELPSFSYTRLELLEIPSHGRCLG